MSTPLKTKDKIDNINMIESKTNQLGVGSFKINFGGWWCPNGVQMVSYYLVVVWFDCT